MRLPAADRAMVDEAKVRNYLLSPQHPVGRYKARVFMGVGYRQEVWQLLRDDLVALAKALDVTLVTTNEHGQRFLGAGMLTGPTGRTLPIVTIWLISSVGEPPRLITAYPGRRHVAR